MIRYLTLIEVLNLHRQIIEQSDRKRRIYSFGLSVTNELAVSVSRMRSLHCQVTQLLSSIQARG
jgi:hypothetical protein